MEAFEIFNCWELHIINLLTTNLCEIKGNKNTLQIGL